MDEIPLKELAFRPFAWHIYDVSFKSFLRVVLGREWQIRLLYFPRIERIHKFPKHTFFSYFVRRVGKGFVQSELPTGVVVQPSDSLGENYDIYRSRIFDIFYDIQDDDVVIDVGAHVGIFTLRAARKASNGIVVAVEPYLPNYDLLMYNLNHNKIQNVIGINEALSDFKGTTRLHIGIDSLSHTIDEKRKDALNYVPESSIEVKTETLDELINRLNLHRVDFVKVNAEGSELSILKGAKRMLENYDVSLAIAADHYPTQIQEITGYLQRKGYAVLRHDSMPFVYATRKRESALVKQSNKCRIFR